VYPWKVRKNKEHVRYRCLPPSPLTVLQTYLLPPSKLKDSHVYGIHIYLEWRQELCRESSISSKEGYLALSKASVSSASLIGLEAGVKLRFPQTTITAAVIIGHRFTSVKVVQTQKEVEVGVYFDSILTLKLLSEAVLLIASKTLETPTRVRDVVNVVYRMTHPPPEPALEIGSVGGTDSSLTLVRNTGELKKMLLPMSNMY
jgi:hypothetical protein